MISRSRVIVIVGLAGMVMFVWLSAVRAETSSLTKEGSDTQQRGFCQRLPGILASLNKKLAERQTGLEKRRNDRMHRLTERRAKRSEQIAELRGRWNERRAQHLTMLHERATSEVEKLAVARFQQAVASAVATRRASVDTAVEAFRSGVNEVIASRKVAVDKAIATFISSISAVEDTAREQCAGGTESRLVRQGLHVSLRTAREKFRAELKNAEKLRVEVRPMNRARREAIDRSIDDFKSAMEKARQELNTALSVK